jgi:predicted ATPase
MLYHITNEKELEKREFGNDGEYALQYLNVHGNDNINNKYVMLEGKKSDSLRNQVILWLDRISPGVSPQVQVAITSRTSELYYDFVEGKEKTNSYKSVNVGFGITYVLPIVIALLAAEKGDIVIIENPEAHIHPLGQRMLGELIALAGAGGVQIFVETHSDHIINGLRIMVKEKKVSKDDIGLAYFYKDDQDNYKHKYVTVGIEDNGQLDNWPDGFLDEWDKALYDLI